MIAVLPTKELLRRLNTVADSAIVNEDIIIAMNEAIDVVKDANDIAIVLNSNLEYEEKIKTIERIMFGSRNS